MPTIDLYLGSSDEGMSVRVCQNEREWQNLVSPAEVDRLTDLLQQWTEEFEGDETSYFPEERLRSLGEQLKTTLPPDSPIFSSPTGDIILRSEQTVWLNWPWELLPRGEQFLATIPGWTLQRTFQNSLIESPLGAGPSPLRVVFMASAPTDQDGLDYEKEEEAILRITSRYGQRLHLHITETGTWQELREVMSRLSPHVVHLSGHGVVDEGQGYFAFEDEHGNSDFRDANFISEQIFAGRDVRLVFFNACQSSQAAVAGLCQTLTATGNVSLALGWAVSIEDDLATQFADRLFSELAAGTGLKVSLGHARRDLLYQGRLNDNGQELLHPAFALPQLYASNALDQLVDTARRETPDLPNVRFELLGDNIRGLREGFVGRRRALQDARSSMRSGEKTVLFLSGMGGAGKSTLATRIANRFQLDGRQEDGYKVVAIRATPDDVIGFGYRLLEEAAVACQILGDAEATRLLRNGGIPFGERLRLLVDILNSKKILLVLDNLEAILNEPPAPPTWKEEDIQLFMEQVCTRLTGLGRAILTCRYIPVNFNLDALLVLHIPLPDFTVGDFFKYLRRHEGVARRVEQGELSLILLDHFYRKLGATPRFLEQACAILARIAPADLETQLASLDMSAVPDENLARIQQEYFRDLFLPQLLEGLPEAVRLSLCRLSLVEMPLPVDGFAQIANIDPEEADLHLASHLNLGLLQRFGENGRTTLFAVYPLQRVLLSTQADITGEIFLSTHGLAANWFRDAFERDREGELGFTANNLLVACFKHAVLAEDQVCTRWAAVTLASRLSHASEHLLALSLLEPVSVTDRHPMILLQMGLDLTRISRWDEARSVYMEALASPQITETLAATIQGNLAGLDLREGNTEAALRGFKESLDRHRANGNRREAAASAHNLALMLMDDEEFDEAEQLIIESWSIFLRENEWILQVKMEISLGILKLRRGDEEEAKQMFVEILDLCIERGNRASEISARFHLAHLALSNRDYREVRTHLLRVFHVQREIGDWEGEAKSFGQVGIAAAEIGDRQLGALLTAISLTLLSNMGSAQEGTARQNLERMAKEMDLDQEDFDSLLEEAGRIYEIDGGEEAMNRAFEQM